MTKRSLTLIMFLAVNAAGWWLTSAGGALGSSASASMCGGCGEPPPAHAAPASTPAPDPGVPTPEVTPAPDPAAPTAEAQPVNDEATCPVKGTVGKKADMVPFEYQGQTYYLCCPACAEAIKADPGKYLTTPEAPPAEATAPAAPTAPPAAAAPAQTEQGFYYTCPMHPEVKLDHPGSCPECGMTLVKKQK